MSRILTVSQDQLEALAFTNPGHHIHIGAHSAQLELDGVLYVARLEQVA